MKKEFNKILDKLSYRHNRWDVFADFCKMSSIALAQTVYKSKDLEEEFLQVEARYNEEERKQMAELLSYVQMALDDHPHDFLGQLFMENELGNHFQGQYFTPYPICQMMAEMVGLEGETLHEPACGSGAMIIAYADVRRKQNRLPPIVEAWDISEICWRMAYIQLSILGIPARVVMGDTLAMKEIRSLKTPLLVVMGKCNI